MPTAWVPCSNVANINPELFFQLDEGEGDMTMISAVQDKI